MKKIYILLAVLLAGMLGAGSLLPWGLPLEEQVADPAQGENGALMVAENRPFTARIYTVQDGSITGLYEESRLRGGRESTIACVEAAGDAVSFVRVMENGWDWELASLRGGTAEILFRGVFEDPVTVTGLRARGESFWITAVGDNGAIFVYEYKTAEQTADLRLLLPAWWLRDTVWAEYDGEVIRAATAQGDTCFLTPTGSRTYTPDAAQTPLPELIASGSGWLLCKRLVLLAMALLWAVMAVIVWGTGFLVRRSRRLAARITAVGAGVLLLTMLAASLGVLSALGMAAGLTAVGDSAPAVCAGAGAVWLAGVLLLWSAASRTTGSIAALTHQMSRMAEGDMTPQKASSGKDELCRLDRSLQELCMNLSVWEHEMNATIRSYQRFVPQKLPALLGCAVMEEVRLGESLRTVGNVGLFSVGNRTEVRNALEDAAFVDFINHSFGIFHDCVQDNHGWMLSSGLRLSCMEALFPDSPADGVRAGLDFLGKAQVETGDGIPRPGVCLILHKASFLYGIAGREDRLFPYLSSAELEFLGSYAGRFHEAGVRIVVTESYWKQLKGMDVAGRYIGFVCASEQSGAYKLYEILDAYPKLERDLRRGYDQRFQEALDLFYHNDFYLARNLFSALLRACPGDGVARWYLFACERYFHQQGDGEVDYSLFGMEP